MNFLSALKLCCACTSKKGSGVLRTGELSYDSASCRIRRKGNVLELTATEAKLAGGIDNAFETDRVP